MRGTALQCSLAAAVPATPAGIAARRAVRPDRLRRIGSGREEGGRLTAWPEDVPSER